MNTTYSIADARREFAQIISRVNYTGETVTIKRHGTPVARIISIVPKISEDTVNKYFGIWKHAPWAKDIGKPSRRFRRREIASL